MVVVGWLFVFGAVVVLELVLVIEFVFVPELVFVFEFVLLLLELLVLLVEMRLVAGFAISSSESLLVDVVGTKLFVSLEPRSPLSLSSVVEFVVLERSPAVVLTTSPLSVKASSVGACDSPMT